MPAKFLLNILLFAFISSTFTAQNIPLPEHPNPIFERADWINLNGIWDFKFDPNHEGLENLWFSQQNFKERITVPFPWGSALSGVKDEADIGWYQREIEIPNKWRDKRVFLQIGASDWETTVWIDNQELGNHRGGYVPFEFELTEFMKAGQSQKLTIRVDDLRRMHTLFGKQGYGNARGIWQTVILEARGDNFISQIKCTPDIDKERVMVEVELDQPVPDSSFVTFEIESPDGPIAKDILILKNRNKGSAYIPIPNPTLWNLENPHLYNARAIYKDDQVTTYFGMRKISVVNLPGTSIPYIALNNKPIYLQLALDQSYHPEGFYTFPSDQFMKEEIERSKSIGLNGIRTHIKVEVPRKLYWADKLGLLVMEDLPNSWGEPDEDMRRESIYTLEEMIKRDYNHPSIFSWVIFNESWGLSSPELEEDGSYKKSYSLRTQRWVESMYHFAKALDPTRLVEDNSICCGGGHTITDIHSWHSYLPGYAWHDFLQTISDSTYPGSGYNYESGYYQNNAPNINSECGNVWGYQGSTGDVDWSYDYHRMMNSFRMFPKIAGWLYTEHHDVINEWNGYWRFDRTEKFTGLEEIVTGMSLKDLHAPIYLSTGNKITYSVETGQEISIPLYLSSMADNEVGNELEVVYNLTHIDLAGINQVISSGKNTIKYEPWMQKELAPIKIMMPETSGLAKLSLSLIQKNGEIIHRNFVHFVINGSRIADKLTILSQPANKQKDSKWSGKQWEVLDGLKVNGTGSGYFEYEVNIPSDMTSKRAQETYFQIEVSAKELFQKDKEDYNPNQNFMLGSLVANSSNPNSYPMTDETLYASKCQIMINGNKLGSWDLTDDPADHRGILSWHAQLENGKLNEAGSYGFRIKAGIKKSLLKKIIKEGKATIRIQVLGEGGLAIYGRNFGRFPIDPGIVVTYK